MNEPIRVTEVPEEYSVKIDGDKITVYNRGSGRVYPLENLAPFAGDDG